MLLKRCLAQQWALHFSKFNTLNKSRFLHASLFIPPLMLNLGYPYWDTSWLDQLWKPSATPLHLIMFLQIYWDNLTIVICRTCQNWIFGRNLFVSCAPVLWVPKPGIAPEKTGQSMVPADMQLTLAPKNLAVSWRPVIGARWCADHVDGFWFFPVETTAAEIQIA